jgi:signal transduction histidine kinase
MIEAIRDVIDRITELASGAGVTVSLEAAGPIVGRWDRLRVEQIVDNLLVNAIKYASHAPVEVSVATRRESVEIAIQDHGPGIPDSEQERIFGPFERAVSSRNYGGLGLGLFIARQNALAHGGSLRLANAEPGAKFVVELPWPRPTA